MKIKTHPVEFDGHTADELLDRKKLLDENETAFILGCSVAKLQRDRHINSGRPNVPYIKCGRSVRYETQIISQVIERSRIGSI